MGILALNLLVPLTGVLEASTELGLAVALRLDPERETNKFVFLCS